MSAARDFYESSMKWTCIFGCVISCGIIYSAMWHAHFGTWTSISSNPFKSMIIWIQTLSGAQELALFIGAPFLGAMIAAIIMAMFTLVIVEGLWKAVFHD